MKPCNARDFLNIALFECFTTWSEVFGPPLSRLPEIVVLRRRVIVKAWTLARQVYKAGYLTTDSFARASGIHDHTVQVIVRGINRDRTDEYHRRMLRRRGLAA